MRSATSMCKKIVITHTKAAKLWSKNLSDNPSTFEGNSLDPIPEQNRERITVQILYIIVTKNSL